MRRALVAAALAVLASCTAPVQGGLTGVRLVITYDVEVDQLRVEGATDDAPREPFMRPEAARALSPDGEDLVVLLPDEVAGQTYRARVFGLLGGAEVAAGAGAIGLVEGTIVVLAIHLGPPPACGDGTVAPGFEECDDGNDGDGDGCASDCRQEAGWRCTGDAPSVCVELCGDTTCTDGQRCAGSACVCDPESCPDGCCQGDQCRAGDAASACGAGGLACETCSGPCVDGVCAGDCDATICPDGCCSGATCNPMSVESCGVGGERCEPCVAGSADACVNGECRCGAGEACAAGQRCVAGLCICDETSCPFGCCDGVECRLRGRDTCGVAGSTCVACNPGFADNCSSAGTCQCGSGPACLDGQVCDSGVCRCTAASCPTGCCDGPQCRTIGFGACGSPGGACAACDPLTADACGAGGSCACGGGPACGAGQRCEGGACVCDGLSCAGCCDGATCRTGDTDAACGSGGSACESCGGSGCSPSGACAGCNSTTCASGCCTGSTCNTPSPTSCGTMGGACVSCDPARADGCTGGSCTCGAGAACAPGQRCQGGACVCDATSCPTGCCAGDVCTALSATSCAPPGASCAACSATRANGCGADGSCVCGSNPECAVGQRCSGGMCVCDATSCPTGCCSGQTCTSLGTGSCAPPGVACTACSATTADRCTSAGVCSCGPGGSPCNPGQRCQGGSCVCDPGSCSGCCDGNVCRAGTSATFCGTGGAECVACGAGICMSGVCTSSCSNTTCGNGCCSGSTCVSPPTVTQCGIGAEACIVCGPGSNRCDPTTGACRCGMTAPCPPGLACVGGSTGDLTATCACTPTSCAHSCCKSGMCQVRSATNCGSAGGACVDCTADGTGDGCDSMGRCTCGPNRACTWPLQCRGGTCAAPVGEG